MKNLKTIHGKLLAVLFLVISIAFVQGCNDDDDPDPVDKTALSAKITEAENLISSTEEGTANGQYAIGSQKTLQDVIDIAKVVYDNTAATQTDVDNSVIAVTAAITVYNGQAISPIAPDALIGHWAFDAGTGTTAKDYSDNGFDGTFGNESGFGTGVPTWATDRYGNAGKAIAFNNGAKITVPYNTAINPKQITIVLWVNAADTLENNRFIGLHSWHGYKFQLQTANKPFFTGEADQIWNTNPEASIGINNWYHLAVTFGGGKTSYYINGVYYIADIANTTGDLVAVTGHDLTFGVGSSKYAATVDNYNAGIDKIIPLAWGGYFYGTLDEIRMYNTVLTATQIASIYNLEKPQD